jgi:hypothetical protein
VVPVLVNTIVVRTRPHASLGMWVTTCQFVGASQCSPWLWSPGALGVVDLRKNRTSTYLVQYDAIGSSNSSSAASSLVFDAHANSKAANPSIFTSTTTIMASASSTSRNMIGDTFLALWPE